MRCREAGPLRRGGGGAADGLGEGVSNVGREGEEGSEMELRAQERALS